MDRFECPNCGWSMEEEADECTDCARPPARAMVCSIGMHDKCDGYAPNESDYPCSCKCHFETRLAASMERHKPILDRLDLMTHKADYVD